MRVINAFRLPGLCVLLLLASISSQAAWQRIDASTVIDTLDDSIIVDGRLGFEDGDIQRFPGCASAPAVVIDPETGVPVIDPETGFPEFRIDEDGHIETTPREFSFFVDLGDDPSNPPSDLLIYLGGGGACWDDATCIGSALTPLPTYFPAFSETTVQLEAASEDFDGSGAGGILTRVRGSNPYAHFAKVYIPYCTGDVHVGSNDAVYSYPPLFPAWAIGHRGFDNLMLVLKWLQKQEINGFDFDGDITVSGSSAGGYGALINFPVIRDALGERADYSIIVDSANGVLTDGFLNSAFGPPGEEGVWGAKQNLGSLLQPILDQADADSLWVNVFHAVGREYPDTRISQSTSAFDAVQALVLLFMQRVDQGTYSPFVPPTEEEVFLTSFFDWSPKARSAMLTTSFDVWNYRKYLGAGSGHIHLIDPPANVVSFPTTNFFEEDSARNVRYTDWLDDMLNNPRLFFRTDWRNRSCFPNCLR